jgi:opacity protein-like surface antigen
MKYGWVLLLLVVAGIAPRKAEGQAEVYGQFSVTDLTNLTSTDLLYGATTGLVIDGPTWHHMVICADIQGRFVRKSGEELNGAAAGPRFSFPLKKHGLTPYGEFLVGFARYNTTIYPAQNGATTDSQIQINVGVAKQVSSRWDISVDYSYSQYYALGGEYNPKTFSVGAVFHFVKR